jgi:F-box-like
MSTMTSLPQEILVRVFCFLGNMQDIASVKLVCTTFRRLADEESIWHDIAIRKFGPSIYEQTLHLYGNSSYEMVKDNNQLGACPILYNPGICLDHHNHPSFWYACLVRWVRWHRPSRTVQVFIDARGEDDMWHPFTNGITFNGAREPGRRVYEPPHRAREFAPMVEEDGHYKGLLIYPEDMFMRAGEYFFRYAISGIGGMPEQNYTDFVILTFQRGLKDAFPEYSLESLTDDDDTDELDRELWRAHVPAQVMERRDPRPWWV